MRLLLVLSAALSFYQTPVLNPTPYRSVNEAFVLDVDPSEPDGSGSGDYRLTRDGIIIWERQHPFTFFEAAVANDGTVAGVAYSLGLDGGSYGEVQGDLRLVVLTPSGEVQFEHVIPRRWSRVIHGLPVPQSKGVLIDEFHNRVLLRIVPDESRGEQWWFYDISTGERSLRRDPKSIESGHLVALRRVSDESLILGQWESQTASRFRVLTPELESIWTNEIEGTLDASSPRQTRIASVTRSGFTIAREDVGELIDFTLTQRDGRTLVSEKGRRPAPLPSDPFENARKLDLPLRGTIDVGRRDESPMSRVFDFDIDGKGRFGFVPCGPTRSLTVVDRKGSVVAAIPLELMEEETSCFLVAWLSEDTWVVAPRDPSGEVTPLVAIDIGTRRARPFATVDGNYLKSLRSAGGRGVLVLHGLPDKLRFLDSRGDELAHLREDFNDDRALFSPEDVAGLSGGDFAVLDVIRHVVQRFSPMGSYIETIDLASSLGKEPLYPATLAASSHGQLAIWDSGEYPLIRLTDGGTLLAEHMPRYDDGSPTGRLHDLRYDPDGGLWGSDGEALLRINDEGVVDAVVGHRPAEARLTEVGGAARDFIGRFYLLDRRTASVHVFEPDGTFSHRCDPAPDDFDEQLDDAQLSVSGDGTVYLSNGSRDRYLIYDADGRRVESRPTRLDTIAEDWYAHPRGPDLWITTMEDLFLTDASGNVVHRIRRHGDRTWLDAPGAAAVASDGTVALLTGERGYGSRDASLGVFTTDGEAVLTRHFPGLDRFASIAFDADVIVLGTDSELLILDSRGEPLGRFAPKSGYDRGHWRHFLSDDGRELQLLDTLERRVYRYDLSVLE